MALADPFYPDPAMPESVEKAMIDAISTGFPGHYTAQNGFNSRIGSGIILFFDSFYESTTLAKGKGIS